MKNLNINIKSIILFFLAILALGAIFSLFPNKHSSEKFNAEKTALEERITENRKIREENRKIQEETYKAWKAQDAELESQINADKEKLKALEVLTGEKSSFLEFVPKAQAYENIWTASSTPASAEPWYHQIQCAIGTGSHDVRHLAKNYPGVAGWKNNNPSGITLGSKALEKTFDDAGIKWFVWTARPKNEGSHYYGFPDLENGMKAKLLIIRRSYKNSTISSYLTKWWTDDIVTEIRKSRTIGSLSDSELISLIKPQIRKESGKDFTDFIFEKVLICK